MTPSLRLRHVAVASVFMATLGKDTLARFSSRGLTWIDFSAKPDLFAPGCGGADCEGVVWDTCSEEAVCSTARASDKVAWNADNIIWNPVESRRRAWAGPE